jgi:hypothetical protein
MSRNAKQPQPNAIIAEPATPQACAADYANRDRTGDANTQHGGVYASAQDGIPRSTGGR